MLVKQYCKWSSEIDTDTSNAICVVTDGTPSAVDVNVGLIAVFEKAFGHPYLAFHYNGHQQALGMKIIKQRLKK